MTIVKARKVLIFNFSPCILQQFEYTSHSTQNTAWWQWQTYQWWRSWWSLQRSPWGCPCPGSGSLAMPSPSRTRRNPKEQSLLNSLMLESWMLWSANLFLTTAAVRTGGLSFCRGLKDRLWVKGYWPPSTRSKRENLFVSYLHLELVTCFIFHPASQCQQCTNILIV